MRFPSTSLGTRNYGLQLLEHCAQVLQYFQMLFSDQKMEVEERQKGRCLGIANYA